MKINENHPYSTQLLKEWQFFTISLQFTFHKANLCGRSRAPRESPLPAAVSPGLAQLPARRLAAAAGGAACLSSGKVGESIALSVFLSTLVLLPSLTEGTVRVRAQGAALRLLRARGGANSCSSTEQGLVPSISHLKATPPQQRERRSVYFRF